MSNYATLGLDINAASGTSDNENRSNDEATAVKGCGCEQGVPCEHDNDDSNGGHYHGDGHDHGGCGGHAHDMIERFSTQIGGENGKGIVAAATLGSEASATAGSSAEGTGVVFQSIPNPTSQDLASGNLGFTLNDTGGVGAGTQALAGFQAAAELWTYLLGDNININLDVGFSALDPGILGSTGSTKAIVYYDDVRTALVNDQTSAEDASAASNLAAGNSLSFVTNDTNGTQIVDSDGSVNNRVLAINSANAKALGITVDANGNAINPNQSDGSVRFSSSFNWDFDPTDGIDAGAQDFVGVAFHEIGHALGFTSGVDIVDQYTGSGPGGQLDLNGFAIFNVLDLFRYSGSGQLNYAIGGNPYFSIDGGNTAELGATFSTGSFQGDGRQASHWKDGLGLGILDPTANPSGNLNNVSNLDLLAFDVVGYDRVVDNVAQGNEFNNSLNGSAVRDLIDGRGGNDILNGFAGEDRLVGRTGDDTLNGGAGADILDGGDGNDTASYAGATGGVSVSLATGTGSAGDAAGDSLISIENLVGSSGNDILTGGDGSNVIDAGDGDDSLFGSQSNNGWDFLNGEAGNDTYTFERTNGNTKIDATQSETANSGVEDKVVFTDLSLVDFTIGYDAESNDALRLIWENGAGTSELQIEQEGQHIEIFEFGDGTTLSEIEGDFLARLNPTVYSNFYANRLTGTDGDDFIQGTGRRDYIYAGAGNDDLSAGGNSDAAFQYLFGQAGDDTYRISKEDGRIFILANAETESSGTNDKVIFSDLGLTDIVFDTYDYTGTANAAQGNTLRLTWNDGTNNGELWVAQDGRHIESYEFADGSTFEANFLARLNPTVYSNFYANRLIGTDGDDVIQGTDRRDYIYAGAG
ncbi:MAG: NF038122 family metalloprotease, partial [Pseudomonadota bacterium]